MEEKEKKDILETLTAINQLHKESWERGQVLSEYKHEKATQVNLRKHADNLASSHGWKIKSPALWWVIVNTDGSHVAQLPLR